MFVCKTVQLDLTYFSPIFASVVPWKTKIHHGKFSCFLFLGLAESFGANMQAG